MANIKNKISLKEIISGNAGDASRYFDLTVQALIIISIAGIVIGTLPDLDAGTRSILVAIETTSIILFTVEYGLRIYSSDDKLKYLFSFWGLIDFFAIVPTLFLSGFDLRALRALRLMRLARILKLGRYSKALQRLTRAMHDIKDEFVCFLFISLIVFFLAASGIYYFENEAQPDQFSSIPASMWWAVATLTTVGYGDVYPITAGGRVFTTLILMIGLGLVAVPAGLIAAALQDSNYDAEEN